MERQALREQGAEGGGNGGSCNQREVIGRDAGIGCWQGCDGTVEIQRAETN
jgi:hypothetical protein